LLGCLVLFFFCFGCVYICISRKNICRIDWRAAACVVGWCATCVVDDRFFICPSLAVGNRRECDVGPGILFFTRCFTDTCHADGTDCPRHLGVTVCVLPVLGTVLWGGGVRLVGRHLWFGKRVPSRHDWPANSCRTVRLAFKNSPGATVSGY
jgi:hypothetical protein